MYHAGLITQLWTAALMRNSYEWIALSSGGCRNDRVSTPLISHVIIVCCSVWAYHNPKRTEGGKFDIRTGRSTQRSRYATDDAYIGLYYSVTFVSCVRLSGFSVGWYSWLSNIPLNPCWPQQTAQPVRDMDADAAAARCWSDGIQLLLVMAVLQCTATSEV